MYDTMFQMGQCQQRDERGQIRRWQVGRRYKGGYVGIGTVRER
jgi:hypothetical protein